MEYLTNSGEPEQEPGQSRHLSLGGGNSDEATQDNTNLIIPHTGSTGKLI